MPTHLSIDEHLEALREAAASFRDLTERARTGTPVPTCPGWDVLDLIAHQGRVHRWATSRLIGGPDRREQDFAEGRSAPDPWDWFDEGVAALLEALLTASDHDDARQPFLTDAPPVRPFWARRQAHETTIHAVDALAAVLGRTPTTTEAVAEIPMSPAFAADGVDELLCGFLPAGRSRLHADEPYALLVESTDTGHAWTVRVGSEHPETSVGRNATPVATYSGTAVGLYLGLWNRGDELGVSGRPEALGDWRALAAI